MLSNMGIIQLLLDEWHGVLTIGDYTYAINRNADQGIVMNYLGERVKEIKI